MNRKSVRAIFILAFLLVFVNAAFAGTEATKEIEVNTLVIPSRNHTRMQPEIFYAFKTSATRIEPFVKMNFVVFNPFRHALVEEGMTFQKKLAEFMELLNRCVTEVVAVKKANPHSGALLKQIRFYMKAHPKSPLSELYARIQTLMKDFQLLVIESSDTYGPHPIFYEPNVTIVDTPEGANAQDIMETLYDLFFVDAAFKQHKAIWGTCHGAQIGYIHAGGKLERLFAYKDNGYDVDFKKTGQRNFQVETWHINKTLNTHKKDSEYYEYGMALYPVPQMFKGGEKQDKKLYMNKDYEHSLGMVEPIPKDIEVISYHPFSEYKQKHPEKANRDDNEAFSDVLKSQILVDAYRYKTMLGTQYHPQYTYDDLETSIIFDYLVGQLIVQMTD